MLQTTFSFLGATMNSWAPIETDQQLTASEKLSLFATIRYIRLKFGFQHKITNPIKCTRSCKEGEDHHPKCKVRVAFEARFEKLLRSLQELLGALSQYNAYVVDAQAVFAEHAIEKPWSSLSSQRLLAGIESFVALPVAQYMNFLMEHVLNNEDSDFWSTKGVGAAAAKERLLDDWNVVDLHIQELRTSVTSAIDIAISHNYPQELKHGDASTQVFDTNKKAFSRRLYACVSPSEAFAEFVVEHLTGPEIHQTDIEGHKLKLQQLALAHTRLESLRIADSDAGIRNTVDAGIALCINVCSVHKTCGATRLQWNKDYNPEFLELSDRARDSRHLPGGIQHIERGLALRDDFVLAGFSDGGHPQVPSARPKDEELGRQWDAQVANARRYAAANFPSDHATRCHAECVWLAVGGQHFEQKDQCWTCRVLYNAHLAIPNRDDDATVAMQDNESPDKKRENGNCAEALTHAACVIVMGMQQFFVRTLQRLVDRPPAVVEQAILQSAVTSQTTPAPSSTLTLRNRRSYMSDTQTSKKRREVTAAPKLKLDNIFLGPRSATENTAHDDPRRTTFSSSGRSNAATDPAPEDAA